MLWHWWSGDTNHQRFCSGTARLRRTCVGPATQVHLEKWPLNRSSSQHYNYYRKESIVVVVQFIQRQLGWYTWFDIFIRFLLTFRHDVTSFVLKVQLNLHQPTTFTLLYFCTSNSVFLLGLIGALQIGFVLYCICLIFISLLGHRLRDDLVDWNSGVSVRPYVHKKFFRFPSNLVCG